MPYCVDLKCIVVISIKGLLFLLYRTNLLIDSRYKFNAIERMNQYCDV